MRNYLTFMSGSDAQQVAYTITLFREAAHEWYMSYERRNRGPPRDWAQLRAALLDRFGSNIRSQEAQSQLMSISQGQRSVRDYTSQFETLLGRLDSYDEGLMLNQFIWGLQPELARSVNLHYPKTIAQAVSLAETTELAIKASRRPSGKGSTTGNPAKTPQGQGQRGGRRGGYFPGRGRRGRFGGRGGSQGGRFGYVPGRGRGRNFSGHRGQSFGGSSDPQSCYVCGVRGHFAHECPQQTTSYGGNTSNSGNQPRSVHRGTSSNRSRGRRARFSGLNVVYDAEGHEYPVDDDGMIYVPANEQAGATAEEEQPQQENC